MRRLAACGWTSLACALVCASGAPARADIATPPTPVAGTPVPRTFTLDAVTVDPEAAGRFGALPESATLASVSITSESVTMDALRTIAWTRARIALRADRDVRGLVVAIPMDLATTNGISVWSPRVRVGGRDVAMRYRERGVTIDYRMPEDFGGGPTPRLGRERWLEWTMDVPRGGVVVETSWASPLLWQSEGSQWRAMLGYSTSTGMRWHGRAAPTVTLRVHAGNVEVDTRAGAIRRRGEAWQLDARSRDPGRVRLFGGERRFAVFRMPGSATSPPFADALAALPREIPAVVAWLDRLAAIVAFRCTDELCESPEASANGRALLALFDEGAASPDDDVRRATWAARRTLATRALDHLPGNSPGVTDPRIVRCAERVSPGARDSTGSRRDPPASYAERILAAALVPSEPGHLESASDAARQLVGSLDTQILAVGCSAEEAQQRSDRITVVLGSGAIVVFIAAGIFVRRRHRA